MKKLVEDLLLLAKLDRKPELHLQETRLDQLSLEMEPHLRMLAQGRSVAIQTIPLLCRCDPDKIKQVIYNLFHNAVQHTDSTTGQITVSANKTKDQVVLLVADNGAGIPKEHLPICSSASTVSTNPGPDSMVVRVLDCPLPNPSFPRMGADERGQQGQPRNGFSCRVAGHQSLACNPLHAPFVHEAAVCRKFFVSAAISVVFANIFFLKSLQFGTIQSVLECRMKGL